MNSEMVWKCIVSISSFHSSRHGGRLRRPERLGGCEIGKFFTHFQEKPSEAGIIVLRFALVY